MKPRPRKMGALAILLTATFAAVATVATHGHASAQGVRGTATTTVRYIELRPIAQEFVPFDQVTELPDGRFEFEGIPVSCVPTLGCIYYRSLDVEHAVTATQDVSLTAWGLGVQGLSFTTLLRGRADLGGNLTWPRGDDRFDAILAYAELNRGDFRTRLGRLRTASSLGFNGYDGASVLYGGVRNLNVEAYGGRSLMRGAYEPRSSALRGFEEFVIDSLGAYLVGGAARYQVVPGTSVALRYQFEIWEDRGGIVSERASMEVSTSQFRPVMVEAAVDYDIGFGRIGKAHATVRAPVPGNVILEVTGRRYLPYFEMSTIWGFFSPVGYHEAEGRVTWRPLADVTTWASAAWRRFEEANATVILRPLAQEGTRLMVGANWRAAPGLSVDGSYRMDRGFGAFLSSGDAAVSWQATPRIALSVEGTAFQQIEQFRIGSGVVYGGGANADVAVLPTVSLMGGATMYRQTFDNRPGMEDWSQMRAWAGLRAGFGRDPGMRRGGAR
jgi:hypothetical protein